jgi:hypothetical protein
MNTVIFYGKLVIRFAKTAFALYFVELCTPPSGIWADSLSERCGFG